MGELAEIPGKPLEQMTKEELHAITKTMPAEQRAAWGRVLSAARDHLLAMNTDYPKAFELGSQVVINGWHLGGQIIGLKDAGVFGRGKAKRPSNQHLRCKSAKVQICRLEDLAIDEHLSATCQRMRLKYSTEKKLQAYIQKFYNEAKKTVPHLGTSNEAAHVSQNTGQPEWYTPPEYIEAARATMGDIDLDPATSEAAQEVIKAKKFYTAETDGRDKKWTGRVWLNPPYASGLIDSFMTKLAESYQSGDVTAACVLVNNATETSWFQSVGTLAASICFPKGRLKWWDDEGTESCPLQGQAVLYLGKAPKKFAKHFAKFGMIYERVS